MNDFTSLAEALPPLVPRNEIPKLLPGLFSKKYLANLDSLGEGPERIRVGRKVVYTRESLISWLEARTTIPMQEV